MEAAELKEIIHSVLDERDSLDHETHADHHRFISEMVESARRRRELREAVKKQVLGWGAIVFVTSLGAAAYQWATHVFGKGSS